MLQHIKRPRRPVTLLAVAILTMSLCMALLSGFGTTSYLSLRLPQATQNRPEFVRGRPARPEQALMSTIEAMAQYTRNFPLGMPYRDVFGELGERTKMIRDWFGILDALPVSDERRRLLEVVETATAAQFPFLQNPPRNPNSKTPVTDLRRSFVPGSRGIVMPVGAGNLRFALHALASLRHVLGTTLPIQIVYAGDGDLSAKQRALLQDRFADVETVDITALLDDRTLQLRTGGWAIKPFAALASTFEQVILLDADCVFLQDPAVLFTQAAYVATGALLFHDRLLWQWAYPARREWWRSQVRDPDAPSPALRTSRVWNEGFSEEGESGVVVLDKSRLDIFAALLHIAWQNTADVRERVTYRLGHGDKESWWFGLELAGAQYAFERHYGSMIGWPREEADVDAYEGDYEADAGSARVCSFVIAHLDEKDALLWYNGGLVRNKKADPNTFGLPTHWMVDGTWEKGADSSQMSCMVGAAQNLSAGERTVLSSSIEAARLMDGAMKWHGQNGSVVAT